MPKITFLNTAQTFDVAENTSILECAVDHMVPLEHDCGGNCACTTCFVQIEGGDGLLSPMTEDERGLLEANDKLDSKGRLGCQCRVLSGEVLVRYPD